jgi:hypothetical protein
VLFHPASTFLVQLPHVLSQIAAAELHTHESVSVRSLGRAVPALGVGEGFEFAQRKQRCCLSLALTSNTKLCFRSKSYTRIKRTRFGCRSRTTIASRRVTV